MLKHKINYSTKTKILRQEENNLNRIITQSHHIRLAPPSVNLISEIDPRIYNVKLKAKKSKNLIQKILFANELK